MNAVAGIHNRAVANNDRRRESTKALVAELAKEREEMAKSAALANTDDDTAKAIMQANADADAKRAELKKKVGAEERDATIAALEKEWHGTFKKGTSVDYARRGAIEVELKRLNKDKETLAREAAATEARINEERNAKIAEVNRKAAKATATEQARIYEEERDAVLKQLAQEQNDQIKALTAERKKIVGSTKDLSYQSSQTANLRGGGFVLNAPQMATRMQQLSEEQAARLKSIDEQLTKLTGKNPADADDDIVANF
jgi:hypothetical protein